jgi:hypothetical protein
MNDISAYVLLRAKNHKQLLEFKTWVL